MHIPSRVDLNVGDVTGGETITTGAAHPAGQLALVQSDPGLLRRLGEVLLELRIELLDPALVTLRSTT